MQAANSNSKLREPLFGKPIEKRGGDDRIQVNDNTFMIQLFYCPACPNGQRIFLLLTGTACR